mmetsp:Transcript_5314/g.7845  ORF Transcript_5314/g.7845 Transcript_5314/m.7845 type:complete len:140 (-) Transcript_5314:304-723(-)
MVGEMELDVGVINHGMEIDGYHYVSGATSTKSPSHDRSLSSMDINDIPMDMLYGLSDVSNSSSTSQHRFRVVVRPLFPLKIVAPLQESFEIPPASISSPELPPSTFVEEADPYSHYTMEELQEKLMKNLADLDVMVPRN